MKAVRKIKECQKLEQFLNYKKFDEDTTKIIDIVSTNYMKRLN